MVGRDERLLELAARNDPASRVLRSPAHREFCRQLFFPRSTASLFFVERIRRSPGRVPPARGPVLEQSMSSRRRNSVGQIEQFARRTNYWPGFVHQPGHSLDSARSSLRKYAQLPDFVNDFGIGELIGTAPVVISALPRTSSQYVLAIEQRLGERSRLRVEGFDRENEQREDFFALFPPAPLKQSALSSRDYSRGLQFLLQRRSENRLSGWAGYTLVFARSRSFEVPMQPPFGIIGFNSLYFPTLSDQRHTVNLFGSYRFKPSVRFSAKALYGSGFPVDTFPPIRRLGPYERLDLRADKSWLFRQWKLSLYGELLNVTNHNNRRFAAFGFNPASGQTVLFTNDGIPVTPTAGLAFDFCSVPC